MALYTDYSRAAFTGMNQESKNQPQIATNILLRWEEMNVNSMFINVDAVIRSNLCH